MLALVTGASRGIGHEIAQTLSKTHRVISLGRSIQDSDQSITFNLNTSDNAKFQALSSRLEEIESKENDYFGILVNCAGVHKPNLLLKMPDNDFEDMLLVNLLSPMKLSKLLLPKMILNRKGVIINIGSVLGNNVHQQGSLGYSVTKAGLTGFTKSLAKETFSKGVRVVQIDPGFVDTDMIKEMKISGRVGTPTEIANLVNHIVENEYINATTITIDGGRSN